MNFAYWLKIQAFMLSLSTFSVLFAPYKKSERNMKVYLFLSVVTLISVVANAQNYVYEKVVTEPTDWSGEYLIVREIDKTDSVIIFNGALDDLDSKNNVLTTVTLRSEKGIRFINPTAEIDAATFVISRAENGDKYYVKSNSDFWIGYNKVGDGSADLKSDREKRYENSISMEKGKTNINIVAKNGMYLRYNADAVSCRFRYYNKDKKKSIKLYKKVLR